MSMEGSPVSASNHTLRKEEQEEESWECVSPSDIHLVFWIGFAPKSLHLLPSAGELGMKMQFLKIIIY